MYNCIIKYVYINAYEYVYNVSICLNMYVTYCIYTCTVSTQIWEMSLAEYKELQIQWFNIVFPITVDSHFLGTIMTGLYVLVYPILFS